LFIQMVVVAQSEESPIHPLARAAALSLEAEEKRAEEANAGGARSNGRVVLWEQKVFAHLGAEEEHAAASWVLDTGATNHMTGAQAAFQDLDTTEHGVVRFDDDSEACIEG
jgi:hypothetical protein